MALIKVVTNIQTDNPVELVFSNDGLCRFYQENHKDYTVTAGTNQYEEYWAQIASGTIELSTIGHACLDDALAELEVQVDEYAECPRWYSPQLLAL